MSSVSTIRAPTARVALRRLRSAITTKLPATTPNQAPRDQLMMMPMSSAPVIAPQAAASARWIGSRPRRQRSKALSVRLAATGKR